MRRADARSVRFDGARFETEITYTQHRRRNRPYGLGGRFRTKSRAPRPYKFAGLLVGVRVADLRSSSSQMPSSRNGIGISYDDRDTDVLDRLRGRRATTIRHDGERLVDRRAASCFRTLGDINVGALSSTA